jgi:uncharacterized protein YgiM (DUF1202 family)
MVALGLALGAGLAACSTSGGHATPHAQPTVTTAAGHATTTTPGVQTSGPRTVLSPIGLHVRAGPSTSAKVLGTAAQGAVLTVLGHTAQAGGWYEVKGETLTGWITGSARLSAPGRFSGFASSVHHFAALYPVGWRVGEGPTTAIFRAPTGTESITVTTAPTLTALGRGRTGYSQIRSESVVACGVTGNLVTYLNASPSATSPLPPYYAQIRLQLDAKHALGIAGNLSNLSGVQTVRDFANSVTFPYPQCEGKG